MPPKAPNAKPGQPLTNDPEAMAAESAIEDEGDPREVTVESLQALIESMSLRLDDQEEELGQLRAEVNAMHKNQPVAARGGPAAPELTVEQALAQANERGKSVLSRDGWVAPKRAA